MIVRRMSIDGKGNVIDEWYEDIGQEQDNMKREIKLELNREHPMYRAAILQGYV